MKSNDRSKRPLLSDRTLSSFLPPLVPSSLCLIPKSHRNLIRALPSSKGCARVRATAKGSAAAARAVAGTVRPLTVSAAARVGTSKRGAGTHASLTLGSGPAIVRNIGMRVMASVLLEKTASRLSVQGRDEGRDPEKGSH